MKKQMPPTRTIRPVAIDKKKIGSLGDASDVTKLNRLVSDISVSVTKPKTQKYSIMVAKAGSISFVSPSLSARLAEIKKIRK